MSDSQDRRPAEVLRAAVTHLNPTDPDEQALAQYALAIASKAESGAVERLSRLAERYHALRMQIRLLRVAFVASMTVLTAYYAAVAHRGWASLGISLVLVTAALAISEVIWLRLRSLAEWVKEVPHLHQAVRPLALAASLGDPATRSLALHSLTAILSMPDIQDQMTVQDMAALAGILNAGDPEVSVLILQHGIHLPSSELTRAARRLSKQHQRWRHTDRLSEALQSYLSAQKRTR